MSESTAFPANPRPHTNPAPSALERDLEHVAPAPVRAAYVEHGDLRDARALDVLNDLLVRATVDRALGGK